jgi:hypothetical protein
MSRSILTAVLFVLAIVLMLEVSLRVSVFNLDAFSYSRMNSYGLLIDSELAQRAENSDVFYELKPDLDAYFAGKKFVTNSQGLADKEYSLSKPENTFRAALVGSSWTMATSVELPDTYQAVLEEKLAESIAPRKAEIINFGVENYGLSEIVATVRYKALSYDPDMIIVAITAVTPLFLWEEDKPPFEPTPVVPAFWQSYLYSSVMELLGEPAYKRTKRPQVKVKRGGYMKQVGRAFDEVYELTSANDIDVVILWLTHKGFNPTMVYTSSLLAAKNDFRFIHAHVDQIAAEQGMVGVRLVDNHAINHPNETGHWLIAEKIFNELWSERASTD